MILKNIKKGDTYICIADLYMQDEGSLAYKKGNIYISDVDGSLKDEDNLTHYWRDDKEFDLHFKKCNLPNVSNENKKVTNIKKEKVNHPSHYTWLKDKCGIEVIDITRHLDFNTGNAIKYLLRAGHKSENGYTDKDKTIEDLKKAIWYINDEIKMIENDSNK